MKVESKCYSCAGEVVSLHDHFGGLGSVRTSVASPKASRPAASADGSSAANQTQTQRSLSRLRLHFCHLLFGNCERGFPIQKYLCGGTGGVNSARNSFQALVTQAQACGHSPPSPWVALLAENQPSGLLVLKPWRDLLGGRRRTTPSPGTDGKLLRASGHKSGEQPP